MVELIRLSEISRAQLGQAHAHFKHKLDVPSRMKDSLKAEPVKWVGGSLAAGFLGSFLFKGKNKQKTPERVKTVKKERNFLISLLLLGLTMAKPAAKIYATKLLKDYFRTQLANGTLLKKRDRSIPPY
ncbi:hypothetical protein ACFSSA_03595 [Luteolibacter algae]|uniref:Uncharacterized protein n=1 Tax=Luteolibacter algae TaxID=454151 RepID=A0ABW5D5C9_9BACT